MDMKIVLKFPAEVSGSPVVCDLAKRFDLSFNILKARITPRQQGRMTLELVGDDAVFEEGLAYLREHGIEIVPVDQQIARDEDLCIHCGMCTALCPSHALFVDQETRQVIFDRKKCINCGECTKVCPVRAMSVTADTDL